jgi:glycosyltransferase involved in cell wall biosynthesis
VKVLHVIPSVAVAHGGPSRAMVEIERALAARGIACTTATTDEGLPAGSVPLNVPVEGEAATRFYFPVLTAFYKVSPALWRWLAASITQYDVVHVHALFSMAPLAAAYCARRASIPYVVRPLGVLSPYGMQQRRPLLKQLSFRLLERGLIEAASAVHFTSQAEMDEAAALNLRCKGVVIPLGIEVAATPPPRRHRGDGFRLLYLSRIDRKKNLDGLLRAVAFVRQAQPGLTLTVAGDGAADYVAELKRLAAALGIADAVHWLGYVDGARKAAALAAADAFVLPSHAENFGIAAVEALAAGLPAIASDQVAIHADIAAAKAGAVVRTDADSIAAAIRTLAADRDGYAAMSAAAHALALRSFSNAAMGERLEQLYRSLVRVH